MTRVNLVDPSILIDQHLIAEFHEIPRVLKYGGYTPLVETFHFGTGHIKFFGDKIDFILYRLYLLEQELKNRKYRVNVSLGKNIQPSYMPSKGEKLISLERLHETCEKMKREPRHYGQHVDRGHYMNYYFSIATQ